MLRSLEYEEVLKENKKPMVFVDVRSPGEFKEATIPGAINIPLFTDEEREEIGTIYVKDSQDKAKKLGIEIVSKKLPQMYESYKAIDNEKKKIAIFCARGGMRSSSIASLLIALGMDIVKVTKGYKGYREYINHNLPNLFKKIKFVVLYGNTGTGKTHLLSKLREMGYDTLDLEAAANHRGSLLGSVGLGSGNSQKMFESLVFEELSKRKTNLVFTEGESKRIDRIIMPEFMFNAIENGTQINITAPLEYRIKNIKDDYLINESSKYEIIEALKNMNKYISESRIEKFTGKILKDEYDEVISELMITYYDPMYNFKDRNFYCEVNNTDLEECCITILDKVKKIN